MGLVSRCCEVSECQCGPWNMLGRWVHFYVVSSLFGLVHLILPMAVVSKWVIVCPLGIFLQHVAYLGWCCLGWFWVILGISWPCCWYWSRASLLLVSVFILFNWLICNSFLSALQGCTIEGHSFYSNALTPFSSHSLFAFGPIVLCSSLPYFAIWSGHFDQMLFLPRWPWSCSHWVYVQSGAR